MTDAERAEWLACAESPLYFIDTYCQVYDATARTWRPFRLWPAQAPVVRTLQAHRLAVILKARQLGMSWLLLAWALWLMLFRPAATILLFSRRDDEAIQLLDVRLKGMHRRLPAWARAGELTDSKHEWTLSNGSTALAFPTTGGDSYTATFALVDEADLVPDLGRLLSAVKPTIDAGGQMVLLSRADKSRPESEFKQVYRAAKAGTNGWAPVFLPWHARPGRTPEWYAEIERDILSRTGSRDELHEQYPATDGQALAPRSLDKRLPAEWLERAREERAPVQPAGAPELPGLRLYAAAQPGATYVIGADPAEGNPTSDDSAATILGAVRGHQLEEVGRLRGKFEPATFASYLDQLGVYFNRAGLLVERNNHGHAVLLWLRDNSRLARLPGWDGKDGWLSNSKGKALMYATAAEAFRDGMTVLHSFDTYTQLASIDGGTLLAPPGASDDLADSYALALVGAATPRPEVRIR